MRYRPLVTVITPLYNGAAHIAECVRSVREQSFSEWEHIIVDDGSKDDSFEVASRLASEDSRISVIKQVLNKGAAAARNAGLQAARGRFIAFLDADDAWDPRKLEKQIAFMQSHGYALTHTAYRIVTDDGEQVGEVVPPTRVDYGMLLKQNKIGCSTVVYDVQQLGKQEMPNVMMRQDYGLWLRLLRSGVVAFALADRLTTYRYGHASLSRNKARAAAFHWRVLRDCEGLNLMRACYYFTHYVVRSLLKYGRIEAKQ